MIYFSVIEYYSILKDAAIGDHEVILFWVPL